MMKAEPREEGGAMKVCAEEERLLEVLIMSRTPDDETSRPRPTMRPAARPLGLAILERRPMTRLCENGHGESR